MTKYRIIGKEHNLNGIDRVNHYRVQKRVWLIFWKDLRIDSPLFEFETPSAEAADRTLTKWCKKDRDLRKIRIDLEGRKTK